MATLYSSSKINTSKTKSLTSTNQLSIYLRMLALGTFFGFVLVKGEVISWYRIIEMFRFESFHMYGTIGAAVAVGALSVFLLKKMKAKTIDGNPITYTKKEFKWGNVWGGLIFGIGWAFTGACPGPLYGLMGSGYTVIIIPFFMAVVGTWVYGMLQKILH